MHNWWLKNRIKRFREAYIQTKKDGFEEGSREFELVYTERKSNIIINYLRNLVKSSF